MTAVTRAIGNSCEKLLTELKIDLEKLDPSLSPECCIYRVPSNLRRVNEAAYTPHFVSIGPLHYRDKNLKKMEKHKLRYLERFLKRAEGRATLQDFVGYVKENEKRVRRCYAETFDHLNSDKFARIILVDASFIIEHILRSFFGGPEDEYKEGNQLIFDIPFLDNAAFMKDMVLLENQLPFFVLEELYVMGFEGSHRMGFEMCNFSQISHEYFTYFNYQKKPMPWPEDFKHFTDLVRHYQLPEEKKQTTVHSRWFSYCSSSLSEVLPQALNVLCFQSKVHTRQIDVGGLLCRATKLHAAGVGFRQSPSGSYDVKFENGVLELPRFTIRDETSILNVMALEQCHYLGQSYVYDYFILMDHLIDTDKDVDLLVQNDILVNPLGSNQEVASLVNKLGSEMFCSSREIRYSPTIAALNAYCDVRCHKWIAVLRRVYFNTPWRSASTIAAIILLLLTLAQTICSFLSLWLASSHN